jgi:AcrR family transcriptional regulator
MELTPRQQEIVASSIQIIAENGVQHLTIKNIAARIGLTEAAIYRHFPGKLEILFAILKEFRESGSNTQRAVGETPLSAMQKLEKILSAHLIRFTQTPSLAAVIFSEEIFQNDAQLAKEVGVIMEENHQALCSLIREGQTEETVRSDVAAEQLTNILMGSIRLLVNRWHLQKNSFSLEIEGTELWKAILILIRK